MFNLLFKFHGWRQVLWRVCSNLVQEHIMERTRPFLSRRKWRRFQFKQLAQCSRDRRVLELTAVCGTVGFMHHTAFFDPRRDEHHRHTYAQPRKIKVCMRAVYIYSYIVVWARDHAWRWNVVIKPAVFIICDYKQGMVPLW
jgi:hypothetical protein